LWIDPHEAICTLTAETVAVVSLQWLWNPHVDMYSITAVDKYSISISITASPRIHPASLTPASPFQMLQPVK
jgi:hypothetical protein